MRGLSIIVAIYCAFASLLQCAHSTQYSAHNLPIFFFHGVTSSAAISSPRFAANLTTADRPFYALTFCELVCSVKDMQSQITLAITQIRSVVQSDARFQRGYVFIAHSQGSAIARGVIEQMDDHKVHTFISLAGAQNGNFFGPQPSDLIPTLWFIQSLGPRMFPPQYFNFAKYTTDDIQTGKAQIEFTAFINNMPILQSQLSVANLLRSPVTSDFLRLNKYLPVVNNLNASVFSLAERKRRKVNFLKLKAAHFFGSSPDDVIAPWQTSILGQYSSVNSMTELAAKFNQLTILSMRETQEYIRDTYGLKTLDERGGLFLHPVDNVGHSCWVADSYPQGWTTPCLWEPVYSANVYPLLKPITRVWEHPHLRGTDDDDDDDI